MEWKQQFEIIEKIISERLAKQGIKPTMANMADGLGIKVPKLQAWKRGQRPNSEDLAILARELDISPGWLLLGTGLPTQEPDAGRLVPDYVGIGDTLHDLVHQLPDTLNTIAVAGGISPEELRACTASQSLPSALAVSRWIHKYRINANFLLAQVGQPFLSDEEYERTGPLMWVRNRRGDFDAPEDESPLDPLAQRVETVARTMRESGVPELEVLRSVRAMLDGEIEKRLKEGYGAREPGPGLGKAAEPEGEYGDPRKAAGDDSE